MRKLSIILTALFMLMTTVSFSQSTKPLKWAKPQKSTVKTPLRYKIIGHDQDAVYSYTQGYKNYEISKYNSNNLTLTNIPLSLKGSTGERDLENIIMIKQEMFLLSSFQDKKSKKHILYAQTINKSTLRPNTALKKLAELNYSGESNKRPVVFIYNTSPDETKLLVAYLLLDKDGVILRSGFSVFDHECNLIWGEDNISSGIEGEFSYGQFIVDNIGNVYFTGKTIFEKKELRKGAKNEAYVVLCLEKERTFVPVKIELPKSKEAVSQIIGVSDNSELYFVGTYTLEDMNSIVGIYSAKIDIEKQEVDNMQVSDFSKDFLTKGLKASEAKSVINKLDKGNNFENYRYLLSEIEFLSNGTFVVGAEKFHITYIRNANGGSTPVYHYGDMIIASFEQDASMKWLDKIPRDFSMANYAVGNYGFIADNNDNIHVFYNLMKSGAAILGAPPTKAKLVMYSLNKEGESSWKEIYDSKDSKIVPRAWRLFYNDHNNEVILMGNKGFAKTFTKISLD